MAVLKTKGELFRALHEGPAAFVIPNPGNAGMARILEQLGFQALATTSAGFAFSLGRRDGRISRDEALAHAQKIVEASQLPVSADLENCFGDAPKIVAETIRLASSIGLSGGSVEDFSGDSENPIYEFGLAVERVAAAAEAARSMENPFVLTARAENFLHGRRDLDDTIRRLQAFAVAGAEVLFAPGLPDIGSIRLVCESVAPKLVNVLVGNPLFTVAELEQCGARRISVGSALTRAAFGGFIRAAKETAENGTFEWLAEAPSFAELSEMMES